MTDEEIIEDLQGAAEWFREHGKNTNTAIVGICERAAALIQRQQADIKKLKTKKQNTCPWCGQMLR